MNKSLVSYVQVLVVLVVAGLVAWACSQGSVRLGGWPVFGLCMAFAFVVQWLVFLPSYIARTEHFFDLTGSLTYLSVVGLALVLNPADTRGHIVAILVAIWAVRLGSFLFMRVRAAGSDGRFDKLKHSFPAFLLTWTLQGLWVSLSLAAGLVVLTSHTQVALDGWALFGVLIWLGGFALEVIADRQKSAFKADPANEDAFIRSGLWAWSRHPNYLGEILLWFGIFVISVPVLTGWQWVAAISPVFVFCLLTFISGVPLLESRGRRKWGSDPAYQEYLATTPKLLLSPPKEAVH